MSYQLQQVNWLKNRERLKALREKVFVCEYHIPKHIEFDQFDRISQHIILLNEQNTIIASARLSQDGLMSRVAVLPEYRTQTIYRSLFSFLVSIAKDQGASEMSFNCILQEKDKFIKSGFSEQGLVFMEAGIARQRLSCPIEKFTSTEFSLVH
ncbi:GNAT family N-acetyltransferase [Pseudoalteromonas denitrificans]|uniref:Predicted N-acyltransferase, GNAT family n=1 Tax=Pseudoalteromonas denitrificans DSM 6059 TaxID=1123010 RepID=A0A1I1P879_9GAMM|nr:GNAT family N-acetyltransferase [Pseudoalteromonas denitrificans]SFD06141.1 Predicted N-acyltransferase, GNAT family [Pseudoalteromonas denitrificans DSM 6059]